MVHGQRMNISTNLADWECCCLVLQAEEQLQLLAGQLSLLSQAEPWRVLVAWTWEVGLHAHQQLKTLPPNSISHLDCELLLTAVPSG